MFRLTSGFFMCWIDNVCFAEHPTQRFGRNFFICWWAIEIYAIVTGSCLRLFLRCSFRIIFILIRYVTAVAMKAFYDEALRIAFKHCYDFQLVSIDWATVFMQSVHRASRPLSVFPSRIYSILIPTSALFYISETV